VNNFRYTDPMVDFQISVGAEEKALQDGLLGFSIRWVYGVKSSRMKSTWIKRFLLTLRDFC
jgi:hypothetical protein